MKKICFLILVLGFFPRAAQAASPRETPVVRVVRTWSDSVVNIGTEQIELLARQPFWSEYGGLLDALFEDFSSEREEVIGTVSIRSIGSGVVVHKDGIIVTNAHVVNMANHVFVRFSRGDIAEGEVLLINQKDDLAMIRVKPPHLLKAVKLAAPEDIMTGETVVAIGSPYGLENSVSVGVVSGKNRTFDIPSGDHSFTDLIQTDASINMGSSGGALLNLEGELVGLNLAVVQNAQSIGFAVSVTKIREGLDFYEERYGRPLEKGGDKT